MTTDTDTIDAPEKTAVAAEVIDQAQIVDGTPLVKYSATEAGLAALRKDLAGKTYDLKTTKGDQAARADRLRCVTLRTTLEKKRKAFKAPALAYGKLIDAEAERITASIEALEAPIDEQIKADEQRREAERAAAAAKEAARVAAHSDAIACIRRYLPACHAPGMTAERIQRGMESMELTTTGAEFEEFQAEATTAKTETLAAMQVLHAQAVSREAEAARLEAQRVENERVAAELAKAKAELEAQAAAVRAQAAELDRQRREAERAKAEEDQRKADEAQRQEEVRAAAAELETLRAEAAAMIERAQAPAVTAAAFMAVEPASPRPDEVIVLPAGVALADAVIAGDLIVNGPISFPVELNPAPADPRDAFVVLVMTAFDGKFKAQPKPSVEWWAQVKAAGEALQAAA